MVVGAYAKGLLAVDRSARVDSPGRESYYPRAADCEQSADSRRSHCGRRATNFNLGIPPAIFRVTKRLRNILLVLTGLLGIAGIAALWIDQSMRQVPLVLSGCIGTGRDAARRSQRRMSAAGRGLGQRRSAQRALAGDFYRRADQRLAGRRPGEQLSRCAAGRDRQSAASTIQDDLVTLACGYKRGDSTTVVSISLDLYLSAPNVAALRVRSVRAGSLPVPLSSVLEAISAAARNFDLELQWRQSHGDPVALIKLPHDVFDDARTRCDWTPSNCAMARFFWPVKPGSGAERRTGPGRTSAMTEPPAKRRMTGRSKRPSPGIHFRTSAEDGREDDPAQVEIGSASERKSPEVIVRTAPGSA